MTRDRSADLYEQAALALERAAGHFREAAEHAGRDEHARASQHAFISQGHLVTAEAAAQEAAKIEADKYSGEVMAEHPVTDAPEGFH